MNSKPLVSCVIIFLNTEKFIQEAIESVFAQTYDNWELLLVDDGSTDYSTQMALRYAEQYPEKIRYLEHPNHQNRGMSASRNLGISHAQGEYLGFLDADDVWLSHKLEQQVQILNSHPEVGMVYGPWQYWYSWTGRPEDIQRDFVEELGVQTNTLFRPPTMLTLLFPLGTAHTPSSSNFLLRHKVVDHTGGFEDSFRGIYEDQAFMVKVYLKESVWVASECWDRYRQHPDSCSALTKSAGQYYSVRLSFLNWLAEYLSEQGVEETQVWKLLQEKWLITKVQAHVQKREWKQAGGSLLVLLRSPRLRLSAFRKLVRRVVRARWPRTPTSLVSQLVDGTQPVRDRRPRR